MTKRTKVRTRSKPRRADLASLRSMFEPARLNSETIRAICEYKKLGTPNKQSAEAAGISEKTFYNWVNAARHTLDRVDSLIANGKTVCEALGSLSEREQLLLQLLQSLKKAEAEATVYHVKNIREAGKTRWQASAWALERTHPESFGRPDANSPRSSSFSSEPTNRSQSGISQMSDDDLLATMKAVVEGCERAKGYKFE